MDPAQVILRRIEALQAEEFQHEAAIAEHTRFLKAIKEKIELLDSIRKEAGLESTYVHDTPPQVARNASVILLDTLVEAASLTAGPAESVRALLAKFPGGLPQKDVVGLLEDKIDSTSGDRRRLLYNTIFNLRKRGDIRDVFEDDGSVRIQLVNGRARE